ncbi:MAG: flagellar motor switch protein FliN [Spirochaetes bacterium]|nr:flagellar motor switch protein FliN [Spirochaetota bacterium]
MGDGSLSQDEIDALLQGADDMLSPSSTAPAADTGRGRGLFPPSELNAIRDTLNTAVGSVAPSLSGYLGGRNLRISRPFIEVKHQDAVRGDFTGKYIQVSMDYSGALSGRNLIVFNYSDAGSISSLMMGDDRGVPPTDLSEAHQSTIQEFTNQLLSSMATHFSGSLGSAINTTPAILSQASGGGDLQLPLGADLVKVTYDFAIDGVLNSKLYHIMDTNIAQGLSSATGAVAQQVSQPQAYQAHGGQVGISPVKFPPLDEGIPPSVGGNISLILDVPMTLTVELGRTTQLVQDILGLGEGSIIELDKLAGEPVDLLVNGKLIAKGEVVVIDENFGVRVTDIVSPAERLSGLQ